MKAGPDAILPDSADLRNVRDYNCKMGDGPDKNQILLDWTSRLDSQWNRRAVLLLSEEFFGQVEVGHYGEMLRYDASWMSLEETIKICKEKLSATAREWRNRHKDIDLAKEATEKKRLHERHYSRCCRVSHVNTCVSSLI